jgi:hypothetical protein
MNGKGLNKFFYKNKAKKILLIESNFNHILKIFPLKTTINYAFFKSYSLSENNKE